jgi:hypothetical protein
MFIAVTQEQFVTVNENFVMHLRNAYKILDEKPEGKRQLGRHRHR